MAYTRTGRPPGRPKTKEYVTLMARVPLDVATQAKRYAGLHRQTISDVLRDSLLILLQEEDPYRPDVSDMNGMKDIVSDMNTVPKIVSDMNGVKAPVDISQQPAPPVPVDSPRVSTLGDNLEAMLLDPVNTPPQPVQPTRDYDPSKYVLGTRCTRNPGHVFPGTTQSLRSLAGKQECRQCLRARDNAYRERKRQRTRTATPVA